MINRAVNLFSEISFGRRTANNHSARKHARCPHSPVSVGGIPASIRLLAAQDGQDGGHQGVVDARGSHGVTGGTSWATETGRTESSGSKTHRTFTVRDAHEEQLLGPSVAAGSHVQEAGSSQTSGGRCKKIEEHEKQQVWVQLKSSHLVRSHRSWGTAGCAGGPCWRSNSSRGPTSRASRQKESCRRRKETIRALITGRFHQHLSFL